MISFHQNIVNVVSDDTDKIFMVYIVRFVGVEAAV